MTRTGPMPLLEQVKICWFVFYRRRVGRHVRIACPDTRVQKGAHPSEGLACECVGTVTAWLASEEAAPVHAATTRLVAEQSTIPDTNIT